MNTHLERGLKITAFALAALTLHAKEAAAVTGDQPTTNQSTALTESERVAVKVGDILGKKSLKEISKITNPFDMINTIEPGLGTFLRDNEPDNKDIALWNKGRLVLALSISHIHARVNSEIKDHIEGVVLKRKAAEKGVDAVMGDRKNQLKSYNAMRDIAAMASKEEGYQQFEPFYANAAKFILINSFASTVWVVEEMKGKMERPEKDAILKVADSIISAVASATTPLPSSNDIKKRAIELAQKASE